MHLKEKLMGKKNKSLVFHFLPKANQLLCRSFSSGLSSTMGNEASTTASTVIQNIQTNVGDQMDRVNRIVGEKKNGAAGAGAATNGGSAKAAADNGATIIEGPTLTEPQVEGTYDQEPNVVWLVENHWVWERPTIYRGFESVRQKLEFVWHVSFFTYVKLDYIASAWAEVTLEFKLTWA